MTTPSVLEIILMSIAGLLLVLYLIKSIYEIVDKKKHPEKYKDKEKKEREKLDE